MIKHSFRTIFLHDRRVVGVMGLEPNDLPVKSRLLYQLSYTPKIKNPIPEYEIKMNILSYAQKDLRLTKLHGHNIKLPPNKA